MSGPEPKLHAVQRASDRRRRGTGEISTEVEIPVGVVEIPSASVLGVTEG
jgi:hypothetical protein